MKNIKGTITITSSEEKNEMNVDINITNSTIWYIEKDVKRTIAIYNYKENTLERDNEELYLKYKFKENKKTNNNILEIKSMNKSTNIEIFTKKIYKTNNYLKVIYSIDDNEFIYEIKISNINQQIFN